MISLPNSWNSNKPDPVKRATLGFRKRLATRLHSVALWLPQEDFCRERQKVLKPTASSHDARLGLSVARQALRSAIERNKAAKQALAVQLAGKRAAQKQRRADPKSDIVRSGEVFLRSEGIQ